jgi:hypothetical protein
VKRTAIRRSGLALLASGTLLAAAVLAVSASAARADTTPIGPLPKGPISTVQTSRAALVAVALPRQSEASGRVWRLARAVDPSVARQISEADVGGSVVVVFKAVGRGKATIVFALTRGEGSGKALRSHTTRVTVS